MKIALVVAVAENNVIGKQGTVMPWYLPADLRHFKHITMGHPIIMGRKTYDTINRALPGRLTIIVTRNEHFSASGCEVVHSVDAALQLAQKTGADTAFIIGGGEIFAQSLDKADTMYLTEVHTEVDGDTYFSFPADQWHEVSREDHPADDKNAVAYSFVTLIRS